MTDVYQIYGEIGKGGTGTVYLAYHTRLEKYVVLKQMKDSVRGLLQRREVDILKNLHHPNLPQVYDYLEDGGKVYTVIDYIEGQTLSELIAAGVRCTQDQICLWLEQMADVLTYLHSQTPPILHCDIKPDNIIVTPRGDAVLIDFGISMEGGADRLTGVSAAYASPEQMKLVGELACGFQEHTQLDGRSDIYSLAATFFHLMSGVEYSQVRGSVSVARMELGYSEALMGILDAALQQDRERRPKSAAALLRSVRRLNNRDATLRVILLCRCLSILVSAALLFGGICALGAGRSKKVSEDYAADFRAVFYASDAGDAERAGSLAEELMAESRYQGLLERRPEDRAQLLALLGDLQYASENYLSAASYYGQAADICVSGEKGGYARNELAALAQAGRLDRAQELLDSAGELGMTRADRLFAGAILAAKRGDAETCLDRTRELMELDCDEDLLAKAALAAASVCAEPAAERDWLEIAASRSDSKTVLRGLAAAYAGIAQTSSGEEAQRAIRKSLEYYEELNDGAYVGKTDALNYAIALRIAGETETAAARLEALAEDYPEDYRVAMQSAFCYYELGDSANASRCCRRALRLWNADASPDKDGEESDVMQSLFALAERFGLRP